MKDELKASKEELMEMCKVSTGPWLELCRWSRSKSRSYIARCFSTILDAHVAGKIPQSAVASITGMVAVSILDAPIVEYVIDQELVTILADTKIPDNQFTYRDIVHLPHSPMTVRIAGCPRNIYTTFAVMEDNLMTINADGVAWRTPLDMMVSMDPYKDDPSKMKAAAVGIGLQLYLTHGKDIIEEKPEYIRNPKRNQPGGHDLKVIRGVVGGRFVSALHQWKGYQESGESHPHGSPRPHIRAGHWHLYWTGHGRTEPKLNFLHPCLVNADSVGEVEIQRIVK